ncbi:hypothetical protein SEA_LAHQTEMISH_50 [Microbacterium phage Lahqtemish]|uniref:hypothetical protein n=1 Tax=Microbacterium phage Lahqtemish TaxID=2776867 RepID=UPI0018A65833|nr:hypothetical protein QDW25_gp50 [Microbacterium phage Lahqtemish]QOP66641.1 hypothetical protein SEA_LAHQTEMISH_50 [Microbacterium phage Lahqtemish]
MNSNDKTMTIEADGFKLTIILHPAHTWQRKTKTRIYVSGQDDVDFSAAWELLREKDPQNIGASEEVNALFRKLNRQEVKNMKAVVEELRQTSEEADAVLSVGGRLTFSKKAGCSCGCSPAFVPEHMLNINGRDVESLFITKEA